MNCDSSYNKSTEQLINGMMSFLDESTEIPKKQEEFDELKNPICAGIKNIIGMFPEPPLPPLTDFNRIEKDHTNEKRRPFDKKTNSIHNEKSCRYKDRYIQEVNRLMFCSTMGHPPNDSPEYFKAAENYALYGKEFLDFPTDIFSAFKKPQPSQGFGMATNKSGVTPQLPLMINPTNYCNYPIYQQPTNLVQPMMYSNPFLMTQYLNMFISRETQINTSIVQQQQFLTGGIHERLVYAQMLQQQIQTNQAALVNSCFSGSGAGMLGKHKFKKDMMGKIDSIQACDGSDFMKTDIIKSDLD